MERITKKTIGNFEYDLKDYEHKPKEFNDYDAFFAYNMAVKRLGELEDSLVAKPIDEWTEDDGDCLWWTFPIQEPPHCGSPLDSDFPDYLTHFTRLILPINKDL
ncbi:hypothetical protein CVD28_01475 [Bacillus sp. M6-12]|uniref:hypothetical protein n=1 Tax=Bacillus sp. M6-12 TaxID=2054166 RepID=UPI000C759B7D|nr:hypothetical protein [Bacillus sp. M6-12]PLS19105.1 hypothetical protein CVD28_01475 [Bacillus sp. M6-12]